MDALPLEIWRRMCVFFHGSFGTQTPEAPDISATVYYVSTLPSLPLVLRNSIPPTRSFKSTTILSEDCRHIITPSSLWYDPTDPCWVYCNFIQPAKESLMLHCPPLVIRASFNTAWFYGVLHKPFKTTTSSLQGYLGGLEMVSRWEFLDATF
jgi:hypothetical protein